jgi:predicted amino acid-binding ACT domain protein
MLKIIKVTVYDNKNILANNTVNILSVKQAVLIELLSNVHTNIPKIHHGIITISLFVWFLH